MRGIHQNPYINIQTGLQTSSGLGTIKLSHSVGAMHCSMILRYYLNNPFRNASSNIIDTSQTETAVFANLPIWKHIPPLLRPGCIYRAIEKWHSFFIPGHLPCHLNKEPRKNIRGFKIFFIFYSQHVLNGQMMYRPIPLCMFYIPAIRPEFFTTRPLVWYQCRYKFFICPVLISEYADQTLFFNRYEQCRAYTDQYPRHSKQDILEPDYKDRRQCQNQGCV